MISLARHQYSVGTWLAGEPVEVVCGNARDLPPRCPHRQSRRPARPGDEDQEAAGRQSQPAADPPPAGGQHPPVTRLVDVTGWVSFAGATYKVGKQFTRRSVQVAVVDGLVEIIVDGQTIAHPIKNDRAKEHGAIANPTGRPRKGTTAA